MEVEQELAPTDNQEVEQDIIENDNDIEQEAEEAEETATDEEPQIDDEVLSIDLDEEEPPQQENSTLKQLRQQIREQNRIINELKNNTPQVQSVEMVEPVMPTLEDEDVDYDPDLLRLKTERYVQEKIKYEEHKKIKDEEAKQHEQFIAERFKVLEKQRAEIKNKVSDYDEMQDIYSNTLDMNKLNMAFEALSNPPLTLYALAKNNPQKLKELQAIKSPIEYIAKISKIEASMKVVNRAAPPKPELKLSPVGSPITSDGKSIKLDNLRKKAEATGDFTEYFEYKRALRK